MATVNLVLRNDFSIKHNGYPIKLKLFSMNKSAEINLKTYVLKEEWDERLKQIKKSCKRFSSIKRKNNEILHKLSKAQNVIDILEDNNVPVSAIELKKRILRELRSAPTEREEEILSPISYDFHEYVNNYILPLYEGRKRQGQHYLSLSRKLKELFGEQLCFERIDKVLLESYQSALLNQGYKINTIGVHFKRLKKIYNHAVDNPIIKGVTSETYPFRRFAIKSEITAKRDLIFSELKTLFSYIPETKTEAMATDMFKLIFLLIGINFKDLAYLSEIDKKGRINYKRHKTNRIYSILVPNEAMEIIERNKGQERLLNIIEGRASHEGAMALINRTLKKIAAKINIDERITTYYARHSWATIAREIGVSKDDIALALGHGSQTVTDVYLNVNDEKIDQANRKVIAHVYSSSLE